jgi:hypothetical protein
VEGAVRDRAEVTKRLRVLAGYLRMRSITNPQAERWGGLIHEAQMGKQAGSMGTWIHAHHQQKVEILQAEFDFVEGTQLMRVWIPGERTVAWNPFGVRFFEDPTQDSDRQFHGVITVASTDEMYVGWDSQHFQVFAYHLVPESAEQDR